MQLTSSSVIWPACTPQAPSHQAAERHSTLGQRPLCCKEGLMACSIRSTAQSAWLQQCIMLRQAYRSEVAGAQGLIQAISLVA